MKLRKSLFTGFCAMAASALLAGNALSADVYPNKPVTLVVPFSAGGPTDAVARLIAVPMGKELGQTVIVENTVGAGGTIAATFLKAGLVDRLSVYRGGLVMGADSRSAVAKLGLAGLDFAPRFSLVSARVVGGDMLETWRRAS